MKRGKGIPGSKLTVNKSMEAGKSEWGGGLLVKDFEWQMVVVIFPVGCGQLPKSFHWV